MHCTSGLSGTGTLIVLYMMREHGFTAREAMGWLRIMRPGSVVGEQQRFLCRVESIRQDRAAAAAITVNGLPRTAPAQPQKAVP